LGGVVDTKEVEIKGMDDGIKVLSSDNSTESLGCFLELVIVDNCSIFVRKYGERKRKVYVWFVDIKMQKRKNARLGVQSKL
jgi:hypothetical protein